MLRRVSTACLNYYVNKSQMTGSGKGSDAVTCTDQAKRKSGHDCDGRGLLPETSGPLSVVSAVTLEPLENTNQSEH